MTIKQKILKFIYPAFIFFQKLKGKARVIENKKSVSPPVPFHAMSIETSGGKIINLDKFRGKKVLIVNTASQCGYTAQFNELQKLYQYSKEDLEIIAFPSNDFRQQEPGGDKEIENFCVMNFSIRFLMAKKTIVSNLPGQHDIFQWLTQKEKNGWNDQQPSWNFSKYLVNEEGVLTHYFDPAISPVSEDMIKAVHQG